MHVRILGFHANGTTHGQLNANISFFMCHANISGATWATPQLNNYKYLSNSLSSHPAAEG